MAPAHLISVSVPCSIISLDGHFADCPPLSQTDHKAWLTWPSLPRTLLTAFQLINLTPAPGAWWVICLLAVSTRQQTVSVAIKDRPTQQLAFLDKILTGRAIQYVAINVNRFYYALTDDIEIKIYLALWQKQLSTWSHSDLLGKDSRRQMKPLETRFPLIYQGK